MLRHTARTTAAAERLWAVIADIESWPCHTASITRAEWLEPGDLHVGNRAQLEQPKLKTSQWLVTDVVEGETFTWEARNPGVTTTAVHRVVPLDGGAELELTVEHHGPLAKPLGLATNRLTRRYLKMESDGLVAAAEGSANRRDAE